MEYRVRHLLSLRRQAMSAWPHPVRVAAQAGCFSLLFAYSFNFIFMPTALPASAAETSPSAAPSVEATSEQSGSAQPGTDQSSTEQTVSDSKRRTTLKGSTRVVEQTSGKGKMDKATLRSGAAMQSARISVDQHITLAAGVTSSNTKPFLLRVDKESVSKTVYKCFADMTCLETAEIGSNINNAVGRWQPLLVEESPAAFNLGSSNPVMNVRIGGVIYKINLPTFSGSKRILLATDGEKICAMDLDNNDSWLLRMKKNKDNSLHSATWAKLTHVKDRSNSTVGAHDSRPSRSSVLDAKTTSRSGWERASGKNSSAVSGWEGSGAAGWNSKAKRGSGWSSVSSGRSKWSNSFSGSSWDSKESGETGWSPDGTGSNGSGFDSEQNRRHFRKERRGRSRNSGF